MNIADEQLKKYNGGLSFTPTLLNAISRAVTTLLDLGRALGSAIRRSVTNSVCSL